MRFIQRFRKTPDPEAAEALKDAEKHLERIKERTPEVAEEARKSKVFRQRNHFREQIDLIFMGG